MSLLTLFPGADGGGSSTPLPEGATLFTPRDKYSELKLTHLDGYANGQPDDGTAATHDASSGAVPSYTTAKARSICVVTVAGTLGNKAVAKGDLLMALQDSPTSTDHWAVIGDCTAEFEAAVEAAGGKELWLYGTFMLKAADPDAKLNLRGDFTLLNQCGYTAIHQTSNLTYAITNSTLSTISSISQSVPNDPTQGGTMNAVSRLTLATPAEADNFKPGQIVMIASDANMPNASTVNVATEARVNFVDAASGYVWLDRVMTWHTEIAAASNKYLVGLDSGRAATIDGMMMQGAPTIIGESVGWWRTLFGAEVTATIAGSGGTRTITRNNHGMLLNQFVRLTPTSGSYAMSAVAHWKVASVVDANTFTVTVPSKYDDGSAFSAPSNGTVYYKPAFVCSEFDATTHGGHTILLHAHESVCTNITSSRLWGKGLSRKKSHFCTTYMRGLGRQSNAFTRFSGTVTSGRLTYNDENWQSGNCESFLEGVFQRHAYTGNHTARSGSFTATLTWLLTNCGANVDNYVRLKERNSTGGADTHNDERNITIVSEHDIPVMSPLAESYYPFAGNIRGCDERRVVRQRGGYEGIVLYDVERADNSVEWVDLDIQDLPYQSSAQVGFRGKSHTSKTKKPIVTGRMKFKNCGYGSSIAGGITCRLTEYTHSDIAVAGAGLSEDGKLFADAVNLDFSTNSAGQSTRYGIRMTATSAFRAGVMTVTLGASANPTEIITCTDTTAGKVVNIGTLIVMDPSAVGMPLLITTGTDAYFTLNIGQVIYNGVDVTSNYSFYSDPNRYKKLFTLTAVNTGTGTSSGTDTQFTKFGTFTSYIPVEVIATRNTGNNSGATAGIFTATGGGGTAILPSTTTGWGKCTGANTTARMTPAKEADGVTDAPGGANLTATPYFRTNTLTAVTSRVNVEIWGIAVP